MSKNGNNRIPYIVFRIERKEDFMKSENINLSEENELTDDDKE